MLEVSDKISALADENYWEVKTQCLEFAATILSKFKEHAVLLAAKDDFKGQGGPKASSPQGQNPTSGMSNNERKTGSGNGAIVDKS